MKRFLIVLLGSLATLPLAAISSKTIQFDEAPERYRSLAGCSSKVGYGPLRVESQSPFQSLRLVFTPKLPSTLARGRWEVNGGLTWANIWAKDRAENVPPGGLGRFTVDYETTQAKINLSHGLTDTVQLGVEFHHRSWFGGDLDTFIQDFHDAFGVDQGGRDLAERDSRRFFLDYGEGEPLDLGPSTSNVLNEYLLFSIHQRLSCGSHRRPAMAWGGSLRWQTDGLVIKKENLPDAELFFTLAQRLGHKGRLHGYWTGRYAYFGESTFGGVALKESEYSSLAALEWRFRPRTSIIFQYLISSEGVGGNRDPFSKSSHEIVLGWKGEFKGGVIELGILENIFTSDNSPDFGLHFGYSYRY